MDKTLKDISEKLKIELMQEKLHNQELMDRLSKVEHRLSQYENASEGASEGLWERNLLTDEIFISAPWAKMLGYKVDEVEQLGMWESLIHPDDRDKAIDNFNSYISGEVSEYKIDFRLRTKSGDYLWISSKARVTKDDEGRPILIAGSHTDITEKKQAAEKLKVSEKKYKYLFDNALVGIMRVNSENMNVVEINQKGLQILAFPGAQKHLKLKDIFVDPGQIRDLEELLKGQKSIEEFEVKVSRWDESETWISLSAIINKTDAGQFLDITFRDISEFKENLLELQRLNFELDNFVYHASHDIRSPLRSMMGLIEILKTEKSATEVRKIIDMISGSVNRLDKFVVDLLAMSRNNRLTEPAVPINFMVEINNSVTNFHHVYTTKNLEIRVKILQQEPFYSDLTKIRIVLNNLISNAIKYRKTSDRLVSFINIYVTTTEKEAQLIIEDNGEGISQDKLEKIFDMFYRASENSEGSGLGMYIVKNVIKKLNADIKVESEEGKGTTFTVTVPNDQ